MDIKEGVWHLLMAVPDIDQAADCFREYLNSGSKEFWDQYVNASLFVINLCQIYDNKFLNEKDYKIIKYCVDIHDDLFEYHDYTPNNREGQEKVLEILWQIKMIVYPLTIRLLKENNFKCKEIVSHEYDSLLKNSK